MTDIIDGDTIEVAKGGGTTIRIIGIDTPETVHPSEPVECGGPQASAAAARLLTGKRVQLVYDLSQGRFDAYDRTLAYLTVPRTGDFGLTMVRRGLAAEYTYDTVYAKQSPVPASRVPGSQQESGCLGRVQRRRHCAGGPEADRSSSERLRLCPRVQTVCAPLLQIWTVTTSMAPSPSPGVTPTASTGMGTAQVATPSNCDFAGGPYWT